MITKYGNNYKPVGYVYSSDYTGEKKKQKSSKVKPRKALWW